MINAFGPLSVAIFMIRYVSQVILAPIPREVNGFIGGCLYGPVLGTLNSTAGPAVGSRFAVTLSRRLGLP